MDPIYWAALASFVSGACGYVIIRFWILPIVRYRRLKRELLDHLVRLYGSLPEEDERAPKVSMGKKRLKELRRLMMRLVALHDHDMPYWYRLVLVTRQESPQQASEKAMQLENLPTIGQARHCMEEIAAHLTIKHKLTSFAR